jgi:hypothetical protein
MSVMGECWHCHEVQHLSYYWPLDTMACSGCCARFENAGMIMEDCGSYVTLSKDDVRRWRDAVLYMRVQEALGNASDDDDADFMGMDLARTAYEVVDLYPEYVQ